MQTFCLLLQSTNFSMNQSRVFEHMDQIGADGQVAWDGTAGLKLSRGAIRTSMGANLAGDGAFL